MTVVHMCVQTNLFQVVNAALCVCVCVCVCDFIHSLPFPLRCYMCTVDVNIYVFS